LSSKKRLVERHGLCTFVKAFADIFQDKRFATAITRAKLPANCRVFQSQYARFSRALMVAGRCTKRRELNSHSSATAVKRHQFQCLERRLARDELKCPTARACDKFESCRSAEFTCNANGVYYSAIIDTLARFIPRLVRGAAFDAAVEGLRAFFCRDKLILCRKESAKRGLKCHSACHEGETECSLEPGCCCCRCPGNEEPTTRICSCHDSDKCPESSQPSTPQTTAQPTTAQPTTAQPTTAQPTTAQPTTTQPTTEPTAEPTAGPTTTHRPTPTKEPTTEPTITQPPTTEPTTTQQPTTTPQPTTNCLDPTTGYGDPECCGHGPEWKGCLNKLCEALLCCILPNTQYGCYIKTLCYLPPTAAAPPPTVRFVLVLNA